MENSQSNYTFKGEGLSDEEKAWGQIRFNEYITSYPHLNKQGSIYLLEELVWKECLQERFKKQIGQLGKDETKSTDKGRNKFEPIPPKLQEATDDGLEQIINLKTKLGMFGEQKATDEFKRIQELEEKAAEYRRSHPLSFRTTCPHCARAFYLKRRTEHFEEFISPFADDKVVKNDELHADYKKGIFGKERYSKYLGVSPDYIDWLDEKVYRNVTKKADAEIISTPTPEVPPATTESSPETKV